jgi:hypothetical protein
MVCQQALGRGMFVAIDFMRSCHDVDRHELSLITRVKAWTDVPLVDGPSSAGEFLLAMA